MTKLLTLGLLLLSCGVVEAQQGIYTDCIQQAPSGKTYDICRMPDMQKILSESDENKIKKADDSLIWIDKGNDMVATCNETLTRCWTPCEMKMKEAMKLISSYIDDGETIITTDALYRSPQQKLREEADRMDKRDAAIRKWNAIYQECVK